MSSAAHATPAVAAASRSYGRWAGEKTRAVSVPVLVSSVATCAMGALLPPLPGLVLFTTGLLIAGALLVERLEPLAVCLLYGGSPLTVADQTVLAPVITVLRRHGLGPPMVDIWVRPRGPATNVTATGRRSVLVTRGLIEGVSSGAITVKRATTLLAREAALVRAGTTRFDAVLRVWTIPWVLLVVGMRAVAHFFGVAALVRVMWRTRWIVAAIAVVQAVSEDHGALAALVVAIGATTSLWPRWVRAWQARLVEIGDEAVVRVGAPALPAGRGPVLGRAQCPAAVETQGGVPSPGRHLSVVR